jgi:UDP-N-acetylglucosamine:LPS N-acetylglucosamine transferase
MVPQSELTPARFQEIVAHLLTDTTARTQMAARALARGRPNAAGTIVSHLLTLARPRSR